MQLAAVEQEEVVVADGRREGPGAGDLVAAAIAGDWEAARRVELQLPETGVCSLQLDEPDETAAGCCGGPAPAAVDACCVADAEAKAGGASGCGCDSNPMETVPAAVPLRRASACCGTGK